VSTISSFRFHKLIILEFNFDFQAMFVLISWDILSSMPNFKKNIDKIKPEIKNNEHTFQGCYFRKNIFSFMYIIIYLHLWNSISLKKMA